MLVEVFSDVVCPWCFLGKRRMESAFAQRRDVPFEVLWRPFELNPGIPASGVDRTVHLVEKFGGREALGAAERRLEQLGREIGIEFLFDRIERVPNTRAAHRLVAAGTDPAMRSLIAEHVFSAYFERGQDVGDPEVLTAIAARCGLDAGSVRSMLGSREGFDEIARQERAGMELGVSGVPTFVFDRRYLLSGAQPVHVLLELIDHLLTPQAARAPVKAAR